MSESKPTINASKSPDFRPIAVTGVYGGSRAGYLEMVIYTDLIATVATDDKSQQLVIDRVAQCTLMIPIAVGKQIARWLSSHIEVYEKVFGEVKIQAQPIPITRPVSSDDTQDIVQIIQQFKNELERMSKRIDKIAEGKKD